MNAAKHCLTPFNACPTVPPCSTARNPLAYQTPMKSLGIRLPAELKASIDAALVWPETRTQFVLRALTRELAARAAGGPCGPHGWQPRHSPSESAACTASLKPKRSTRSGSKAD